MKNGACEMGFSDIIYIYICCFKNVIFIYINADVFLSTKPQSGVSSSFKKCCKSH